MTADWDVAVLGAGPAGANAALRCAEGGLSTLLIDEQPRPGGQVWRAKSAAILRAPATPESASGDRLRAAVDAAGIAFRGDARLWQIERHDGLWHLRLLEGETSELVRAKALILAAGAREFVQPVPGWTTPGVLGLAGATALLKQHLLVPGEATVVSGTGPLVFFVASEIRRLGGRVAAIATPNRRADWLRAWRGLKARPDLVARGAGWMAGLVAARVPILWGHAVTAVQGRDEVEGVEITPVDETWAPAGSPRTLAADSLCLGYGLIPAIEAAQLAGLALAHVPALGGWIPQAEPDGATAIEGLHVCGDGAGIRGVAAAEIQGRLAGSGAVAALSGDAPTAERERLLAAHARAARFGAAMTALSIPRPGMARWTTPGTIVCRCESLRRADIDGEIASGAGSANAVKSGLRAGMGPCGGRYCERAVARLIAAAGGLGEADVPPPTVRPPLRPVPLSAMAGAFAYDELPIPKPAPL